MNIKLDAELRLLEISKNLNPLFNVSFNTKNMGKKLKRNFFYFFRFTVQNIRKIVRKFGTN